jgi:hypothetical protein
VKTGVEQTPESVYISNIFQKSGRTRYNIGIIIVITTVLEEEQRITAGAMCDKLVCHGVITLSFIFLRKCDISRKTLN